MNIPAAALEAGARAIADTDCPASLSATCESHHGGCMCRDQARAAFLAMLNAWPGMLTRPVLPGFTDIILPLPQEASDRLRPDRRTNVAERLFGDE